jgi:putative membrane protein
MENKIRDLIFVLVGLVVVVAVVSVIVFVLFGGRYYNGYYGPYGMMGGYGFFGMGILMPVIAAITLIFIVLFVYFIIGAFHDHENGGQVTNPSQVGDAELIAKQRFARGEITEEEYKKIIETLRK